MTQADEQDDIRYNVVVNHEDQYSIWAVDRPVPPGWHTVGFEGPEGECLAHIAAVWTDLRPLSTRRGVGQGPAGNGAREG